MALIRDDTNTFFKKDSCFLCGELVDNDMYIFWQGGSDEAITLHPDCAEYLGTNLLRDCLIYRTTILQRS